MSNENHYVEESYNEDCACGREEGCPTYATITRYYCGRVEVEIYDDVDPCDMCTDFSGMRTECDCSEEESEDEEEGEDDQAVEDEGGEDGASEEEGGDDSEYESGDDDEYESGDESDSDDYNE